MSILVKTFSLLALGAAGYVIEPSIREKISPTPAASTAPAQNPTPAPTEPAPTEPAPAEPAPTEPAPTEPAPTEPAPAEPAPTEPAPTEPAPTEPAPTEPATAAPATAAPATAEPATTELKPAELAPTPSEATQEPPSDNTAEAGATADSTAGDTTNIPQISAQPAPHTKHEAPGVAILVNPSPAGGGAATPPGQQVDATTALVIKAMKESIKSGRVKGIKFEEVTDWKLGDIESFQGDDAYTGQITYRVNSTFGFRVVKAKAYIKQEKVAKWVVLKEPKQPVEPVE